MTEPTESTPQLKARIQRQLLEQIAELSNVKLPTQIGMGTIEPLNCLVDIYIGFMAAPTVTFDPDGEAK